MHSQRPSAWSSAAPAAATTLRRRDCGGGGAARSFGILGILAFCIAARSGYYDSIRDFRVLWYHHTVLKVRNHTCSFVHSFVRSFVRLFVVGSFVFRFRGDFAREKAVKSQTAEGKKVSSRLRDVDERVCVGQRVPRV